MSEVKFTKGDWKGKGNGKWFSDNNWSLDHGCGSASWVQVGCKGKTVAIIPTTKFGDGVMEANAHLIAAAPDMYNVLSDMVNEFNSVDCNEYGYRLIREAKLTLAKARGDHNGN